MYSDGRCWCGRTGTYLTDDKMWYCDDHKPAPAPAGKADRPPWADFKPLMTDPEIHDMVDKARATSPAGELVGWQPIETAPKDGSLILGWDNKIMRGKGAVCVMGWFRNETTQKHEWMNFWNAYRVDGPTLWQPLPPAPDGGKDGAR